MSQKDEEEYDLEIGADDVDFDGIPHKAKIQIAETFGGGIIGAIIGVIVLAIMVNVAFGFISYVHSLNIPVISYLFSPEFRQGFGLMFFGLILFACFIGVLFVVGFVAWIWEEITDLIRFR